MMVELGLTDIIPLVSQLATATGVCFAAYYYIITLKNTQKNLKLSQETRQIQLLLDYSEKIENVYQNAKITRDIRNATWNDFQDFIQKYYGTNNPEFWGEMMTRFRKMHMNGLMIRDGLVDIGKFVDYNMDASVMLWRKYRDVILMFRKAYHLPTYMNGFEYLAEEVDKYRIKMGWGAKTADDFSPEYLNS